jgi:transposase
MILVKAQSDYYGGIDLHSKSMVVCIMDKEGKIVLRKTIANDFSVFLLLISSYKHSITFAVESTFNWYWLVDECRKHNVNIYLAHAYHMRLIHGTKNKNDKLDAFKIASLLRSGLLPYAHACSLEKRGIRDLLRHRHNLVAQRSSLLGQTKISLYQHGHLSCQGQSLRSQKHRDAAIESFSDECARFATDINMKIATHLDKDITALEKKVLLHAQDHYREDLELLLTTPGIGPIIGLTILYEIDTIQRFKTRQRFSSYCRLARPAHTSNGKNVGGGNSKCGNSALKWGFMEILNTAPNLSPEVKIIHTGLKERYPNLKARAILANHFATAVYYMLKNKKPFSIDMFIKGFPEVVSQKFAAGEQAAKAVA